MFRNRNDNNLQFEIILNNEAIVLEIFHSDFWHGKHDFFQNFQEFQKVIN
jgi:hypothetical protein